MKRLFVLLTILLFAQIGISQMGNIVGIEFGQSSIIGDIESNYLQGYSAEIYFKKGLNKFLNYEPSIHLSRNYGLSHDLFSADIISSANWFPAYQNTNIVLFQNLSSSINLISNKLMLEPRLGIGLGSIKTNFNVLDENNRPYENIGVESGYTLDDPDYVSNIMEIHDESYETGAFKNSGLFEIGNERINLFYNASLRIKYQLSNSLSIGLSHTFIISDSDYLDGVKFTSEIAESNRRDVIQSSRILFEYRLVSK